MQIRVGRVSPYARQRLFAALENPAESTVQGKSIRQQVGKRFGSSSCVAQCFRRGQQTLAAQLFPAFAALLEQQAAQFAAKRPQFGPVAPRFTRVNVWRSTFASRTGVNTRATSRTARFSRLYSTAPRNGRSRRRVARARFNSWRMR